LAPAFIRGVLQAGGLGGIALLLALAVNTLHPNGLALLPVQQVAPLRQKEAAFSALTIPEAFHLFQENKAFFLDARAPEVFRQGHIPGAINVMPGTSANVKNLLKAAHNQVFIVYCEEQNCDLAELLASELNRAGYTGVRIMADGWLGWEAFDCPVEKPS
jgi:rhodanese-related sulfurtransferase